MQKKNDEKREGAKSIKIIFLYMRFFRSAEHPTGLKIYCKYPHFMHFCIFYFQQS